MTSFFYSNLRESQGAKYKKCAEPVKAHGLLQRTNVRRSRKCNAPFDELRVLITTSALSLSKRTGAHYNKCAEPVEAHGALKRTNVRRSRSARGNFNGQMSVEAEAHIHYFKN